MIHLQQRLLHIWNTLQRRGPGYFGYLFTGYLIPKVAYHLLYKVPRNKLRHVITMGVVIFVLLVSLFLSLIFTPFSSLFLLAASGSLFVMARVVAGWLTIANLAKEARALTDKAQSLYTSKTFTTLDDLALATETRKAIEEARKRNLNSVLPIARFDNDGKLLGLFGPLPGLGLEPVDEKAFSRRYRYSTDVVLLDGKVLVRKDFHGDRSRFVREWYCLARLYGEINLSAVYRADEKHCILYKNLLHGRKVRDILIDAGIPIRDVNIKELENQGLDPVARSEVISKRAREAVPSCFSERFFQELERQLNRAHSLGITNFGFTINNVIVDKNEKPWFFDFEGARIFSSTKGIVFAYRRDQDRLRFNRYYGERLLTEQSARQALAREAGRLLSGTQTQGWYAPIDFGYGLVVGGLGSTETGTGRWEYLNKRVVSPLVAGKRVLDLGSNNGLMPLLMLRAGAREVVGVELSPELVERAQLVKHIFEWRDIRTYSLTIYNCDMLSIMNADWGMFDVVTAFCSLYFLDADDMARVVRRSAELAPIMVVQANQRVPVAPDGRAERAKLPFLKRLLEENGFSRVEIHAPLGYPRPLFVGRKKT